MAKVSPARWAAHQVLRRVEKENAFTSVLLPLFESDLKTEDRALCHELTLGVIRNQLFLDKTIEHFSGKKLAKLDTAVLIALRMAIYQMRFMDRIPARAAINESVEIVKKEKLMSASGFVNGVLRSFDRNREFDPTANFSGLEKLSVETSHPLWLLEKWQEEFGANETALLAKANNTIPRAAFRLNCKDESLLNELRDAGVEFEKSTLAEGCFVVTRTGKLLYEMAEQGKIVLQDEASQMVAGLVQLKPGENFLDVCAAPGNKTTQIISSVESNGAEFYAAGDLHEHRLETLRKNLANAQIENVKIYQYDAAVALPFDTEKFDAILLDAPCSGTGTIRHNPEIRWSLKAEDIGELAAKQKAILSNAAKLLKKDGRLVYSTCSLEREENEAVIDNFLSDDSGFSVSKSVRTFPHLDHTDGFFAAVLEKN